MNLPRGFALFLLIIFFGFITIRTAWVCDDAYITFRTIDNFVHGYGLTWNVAERVQTYTHPLWMFLVAAFYALTGEAYYTSILLSLAMSVLAVALVAFGLGRRFVQAALVVVILTLSKSFTDFSTSGMENALTHLLAGAFLIFFLKPDPNLRSVFVCSLIACLAALNRLDAILVFIPPLAIQFYESVFGVRELALAFDSSEGIRSAETKARASSRTPKKRVLKCLGAMALGFAPLLLWEIFSIIYYGFPFPNTAYAKLGHGRSHLDVLESGLYYFVSLAALDPIAVCVIVGSLIAAALSKNAKLIAIASGLILYLLYILAIGGDFMTGRFFTLPILLAAGLIAATPISLSRTGWGLVFAGALAVGLIPKFSPVWSGPNYHTAMVEYESLLKRGIYDERGYYYPTTGLLRKTSASPSHIDHGWADLGRAARAYDASLVEFSSIGFLGFYAGPRVHVLDMLALADPLFARLPARRDIRYMPGHLFRVEPAGYAETLIEGANQIADPQISEMYAKLALITRGPLWTQARRRAIWDLWRGEYDQGRTKEAYAFPASSYVSPASIHLRLESIENLRSWEGSEGEEAGLPFARNFLGEDHGILVYLDKPSHARHIETSLSSGNSYELKFILDGKALGELKIVSIGGNNELVSAEREVPSEASHAGFDRILVTRADTMKDSKLGYLRLRD